MLMKHFDQIPLVAHRNYPILNVLTAVCGSTDEFVSMYPIPKRDTNDLNSMASSNKRR